MDIHKSFGERKEYFMSYTYTPYFVQGFSKEPINSKKQTKSASETMLQSDNSQAIEEDYVDEYAYINDDSKTKRAKNFLLGSLIALASLSVPTITMLEMDNYEFENNRTHITMSNDYTDLKQPELECNPEAIAKGGKNDSIVEIKEMMNLLNYDSLNGIPQHVAKDIVSSAMVSLTPINVNTKDAKSKIIEQIKNTQNWIDATAKEYKINPQSAYQQILEYENKYISTNDVVDRVDFSEIMKYQKDLTVLKALIRNSTSRIERNDNDCAEKFEKEVEKAQNFVNKICAKYKLNSKVAGNGNYDGQLTKEEMINLLDLNSLDGLSIEKQQELLHKVTNSYKTIYFGDIRNNNHAKEINKQVQASLQTIQNSLDTQANNYKFQACK